MDPIIRIIDQNGKGNNKNSIVVAKAYIRMGQWYRAFRSIKENKEIKKIIFDLFATTEDEKLINKLNVLENKNKDLKNGITGKNAVILNAMLYLNNPNEFLSILSLEHRDKIIKNLCGINKNFNSFGERIVKSNRIILDYFKKNSVNASPRTISCFIYRIRDKWDSDNASEVITDNADEINNINNEEQMFFLEKYLEDLLIGNWESTDLGKNSNIIYSDDNELLSQQYKTDIGKIDILAKEKDTDTYVVIELKRNQTSDDTVGQISRYMGWVKENLANDNLVKGIIIGYEKDDKIHYALKTVPNIELFLYRINFSLIKTQ
jgi:transcription antitermination factor NusG